MTPAQFRQIEALFRSIQPLSEIERAQRLRLARATDPLIASEVQQLLAQPDSDRSLDTLAAHANAVLLERAPDSAAPPLEAAPDAALPRIAGYEALVEQHRGGQGVVYRALQRSTKRTVAVKVLLGGAGQAGLRRFEREIELVASFRHPNIVAVFDSGATVDGQAYFVMDYVEAVPLDEFVLRNELSVDEVVRLFTTVCGAVAYAHQRGVIHRDLKPSNILVSADGVPHLLDFGLAKVVGAGDDSSLSQTGQIVGTLAFMAPEQARGHIHEMDTRTDVYALGVILYRLLAGRSPYPLDGELGDGLRTIIEVEPRPPSAAWDMHCGARAARARTGVKTRFGLTGRGGCPINSELDTIVLRSLAKSPRRRYQGVAELEDDLRRYAAGDVIAARRDSSWYVLRKLAARHRSAVLGALFFLTFLVAALMTTSTLYFREQQARTRETAALGRATREAQRSSLLNKFVLEDLLPQAGPAQQPDRELRMREALDHASVRFARRAASTAPDVAATVHLTLGDAYLQLGEYDAARTELQTASGLWAQCREPDGGSNRLRALETMALLAQVHVHQNDLAPAAEMLEMALRAPEVAQAEQAPRPGADAVVVLCNLLITLGGVRYDQLRTDEAEGLYRRAMALADRTLGPGHPASISARIDLGERYAADKRWEEAERLSSEALRLSRAALGDEHPITLTTLANRAELHRMRGESAAGRPLFEEALERSRRVLGPAHPDTLLRASNFAKLLQQSGELDAGVALETETLGRARERLGPDAPLTVQITHETAVLLNAAGREAEAEPLLRAVCAAWTAQLGADHPNTLSARSNLAGVLVNLNRDAEALPQLREVARRMGDVLGLENMQTLAALNNLAMLYTRLNRPEDGHSVQLDVVAGMQKILGPSHPNTIIAMINLARMDHARGCFADAESGFAEAQQAAEELPARHWIRAYIDGARGENLIDLGRPAEAEVLLNSAFERLSAALGAGHVHTRRVAGLLDRLWNEQ